MALLPPVSPDPLMRGASRIGRENWNRSLTGHQAGVRSDRLEIMTVHANFRDKKPPIRATAICGKTSKTTPTVTLTRIKTRGGPVPILWFYGVEHLLDIGLPRPP